MTGTLVGGTRVVAVVDGVTERVVGTRVVEVLDVASNEKGTFPGAFLRTFGSVGTPQAANTTAATSIQRADLFRSNFTSKFANFMRVLTST